MTRRALLALVLLAACSSGDDDDAVDAATTTTTEGQAPTFESAPCSDPVPQDPRVECGTVALDDGDVVLPVAIVRSASPDPAPDPIVFVPGGPGDGALGAVAFVLDSELGGDRDVVVYDQRGTGRATPSLDCPEVAAAAIDIAATADSTEVEDERLLGAATACRARLVADGVDLDRYDSVAQADDLAQLRVALGYDEWNLWALSYGATTALELVRTNPEGVRTLYLDGGLPPDEPRGSSYVGGIALSAIEALFAGCAADEACSAAYPTLEADYRALVAEWDAEPFEVVAAAPDGTEQPFVVTGADVVGGTFDALYDTTLIPVLPSLVSVLRARDDGTAAIVRPLLEQTLASEVSEGVERAVQCADRLQLGEGEAPDDDLVSVFSVTSLEQLCAPWDVEPLPASFNEPVSSDVPALVVVGTNDPIQPPFVSQRMAETLSRSAVVELPGIGHGAMFATPCAAELLRSFVASADPDAVDTSCVEALGPPQWAV